TRNPPKKKTDAEQAAEVEQRDGEAPAEAQPATQAKSMTVDEVAAQIKKLETKLDKMIQRSRKKAASAAAPPTSRNGGLELRAAPLASPDETTAEVVSSDYYSKHWGRTAMRDRAEEVDDFGLDPVYAARVQPFFDFLYKRYFRVETVG